MMTNSLAQIAGGPTRQVTEGGDETDPAALAARAAAELPAGFVFATQRRTLKSSARWYADLMRAHRNAGGPA